MIQEIIKENNEIEIMKMFFHFIKLKIKEEEEELKIILKTLKLNNLPNLEAGLYVMSYDTWETFGRIQLKFNVNIINNIKKADFHELFRIYKKLNNDIEWLQKYVCDTCESKSFVDYVCDNYDETIYQPIMNSHNHQDRKLYYENYEDFIDFFDRAKKPHNIYEIFNDEKYSKLDFLNEINDFLKIGSTQENVVSEDLLLEHVNFIKFNIFNTNKLYSNKMNVGKYHFIDLIKIAKAIINLIDYLRDDVFFCNIQSLTF